MKVFGKTKIICTIGPSSSKGEVLDEMIKAGMDAARLNFSHGTHVEHKKMIDVVRHSAKRCKENITIIQDLQGPKIRVGLLSKPEIFLKENDEITITVNDYVGDEEKISTTYKHLAKDVKPDDKILIDDGKIELKVVDTTHPNIICKIIVGGILKPKKGINLPNANISSPSLTQKDEEDLLFGLQNGVDYIALSFVRTANDVNYLRRFILKNGFDVPIISKIEKPEAVTNIKSIIEMSDGIMIARGDLGVEMPIEQVPVLQKMIAKETVEQGKMLIIATQMLETMTENPFPTRAETNDVANAVLDGADAVMLSGETSVGKFPVKTVVTMDKIVRSAEKILKEQDVNLSEETTSDVNDAIARASCVIAKKVNANAIVIITTDGEIAKTISSFRPKAKIIAITNSDIILRKLNLLWGVHGINVHHFPKSMETGFKSIRETLVDTKYVNRGEMVIEVAGLPLLQTNSIDMIKVEKVD